MPPATPPDTSSSAASTGPDGSAASARPLLITSALPYANGPIHFGHVAGAYLPADIYARYHRLLGTDVVYISGTDEHGVSITVNAEKEGLADADGYRAYTTRWYGEIKGLFDRFGIVFDHFSRTSNTDPHYPLSQEFFLRLLREGYIAPKAEQQHYCTTCDRFLPDRYVEGTCYVCNERAARGDECKKCGSWLEATRIIEPVCVTCGNTPEVRDTMQYELDLSPVSQRELLADRPLFADWLTGLRDRLKPNVRATMYDKMIEGEGMASRPITRDLRWGVPVPATDLDGKPIEGHDGKVLYVWFDAPIGYISATIEWARDLVGEAELWRRYWIAPADAAVGGGAKLVHFIGKDNIPFHCIVFPSMLGWQGAARPDDDFIGPGPGERYVLPDNVPSNEFYNLEGRKFSTSDNWMLDNDRMFETFGVDALRWYLTTSMPETSDTHFTFEGLQATYNAELADTVGNYASRVLKFTRSHLGGTVPEVDSTHELAGDMAESVAAATRAVDAVGAAIDRFEFRKAAAAAVELGRFGNKLFDTREPWKLRKTDMPGCGTALACHLQVLAALSVVLTPFVPAAAARLREMLALPPLDSDRVTYPRGNLPGADEGDRAPGASRWRAETLPAGHVLGEPGILFQKIADEVVEAERATLGARD